MSNPISMTRRTFVSAIAATTAVAGTGAFAGHHRRVERIGVQLYTVRGLMGEDPIATLAAVAEAGYAEVETAGYAGLDAPGFAGALKDAGLVAPSAHVPLAAIIDEPDTLIANAQTVGHRFLVLPWLSEEQRSTLDHYRFIADTLNTFGEACSAAGIQLCYHNHDFEFFAIDGVLPFDLLLERCDDDRVKFELDLFWVSHAGADGVAYLSANPERYPLCHVKDRAADGAMVSVGEGEIDFAALFVAGEGLQHYFVEHDNPDDALASIKRSIGTLRKLRF